MSSSSEIVPMDTNEAADHTIDSVCDSTVKFFKDLLPSFANEDDKAWINAECEKFENAMAYLKDHYQRQKPKKPKSSSEGQIEKVFIFVFTAYICILCVYKLWC